MAKRSSTYRHVTIRDAAQYVKAIEVVCERCDRRGVYPIPNAVKRWGWDTNLMDVVRDLTRDCPGRKPDARIIEMCAAGCPTLRYVPE